MNALSQALNLLLPALLSTVLAGCAKAPDDTPAPEAHVKIVELSSAEACDALANWDKTTILKVTVNYASICSVFGQINQKNVVVDFNPDGSVMFEVVAPSASAQNYHLLMDSCTAYPTSAGALNLTSAVSPNNSVPEIGCDPGL